MSSYDGSLNFDTKIDEKGFNTGTKSMSSSIKKLGALIAAAFSIKVLVTFGKQALKIASQLQEVQNVVDVVFKEMSASVDAFAKTTLDQFGLSTLSTKQYISSLGAMGASMGFAAEQNLEMTETLTGLIGDFASFYDISQDRANLALSAVYTGETETLKRYGILITEVNLQEYARQQGITKSLSLMTQQEKVMLRYNYILTATENAQGDFYRTQDSWANQVRILTERWKEFLALIGTNLINVFTPALQMLNNLVALLISATEQFNAFYAAVSGKQIDTQSEVTSGIASSVSEQENLTDAIEETNEALEGSLAGFDDLNVLQQESASDVASGITIDPIAIGSTIENTGLEEATENISSIYNSLMKIYEAVGIVREGFEIFFSSLTEYAKPFNSWIENTFVPSFIEGFEIAKDKFETLLDDMLIFTKNMLKIMLGYWSTIIPKILNDIIIPVFKTIYNVVSGVLEVILSLWDKHGKNILDNITGTYQKLADLILKFYNTILEPIITNALDAFNWLWDEHLKSLVYEIGNFVLVVINGAISVIGALATIIAWIIETFGPAFVQGFTLVTDILATFIGVVADVASGVLRILSGIIKFIVGAFTGDWGMAWGGLGDIFLGIMDIIVGVFTGVINLILDGMNFMIRQLNRIKIDVPDWVPIMGGKSFSFDISELQKLESSKMQISSSVPDSVASNSNSYSEGRYADSNQSTQTQSETVVIKFEGEFAELAKILLPTLDEESTRKGQTMKVVTDR